jgi:hypothetical protein
MPLVSQIVCNVCHAVKKEANHWFTLSHDQEGVSIRPLDIYAFARQSVPQNLQPQCLCSRLCLMQAISHWMDGLN